MQNTTKDELRWSESHATPDQLRAVPPVGSSQAAQPAIAAEAAVVEVAVETNAPSSVPCSHGQAVVHRSSASDGGTVESSDDDDGTSALGGFQNVLGQWAVQSKAQRPQQQLEHDHAPRAAHMNESRSTTIERAAAAPPPPQAHPSGQAPRNGSDREGDDDATSSESGSGSSSSGGSSDGSFGLGWGDTLQAWAHSVGAQAHAMAAQSRSASVRPQDPATEASELPIQVVNATSEAPQPLAAPSGKAMSQPEAPASPAGVALLSSLDGGTGEQPDHSDAGCEVKKGGTEVVQRWLHAAAFPSSAPPKPISTSSLPSTTPPTAPQHHFPEFVPTYMNPPMVPHPPEMRQCGDIRYQQQPYQPSPPFFCPVCNVAASGRRPWEDHIASTKHAQRVAQAAKMEMRSTDAIDSSMGAGASGMPLQLPEQSGQKRYTGPGADVAAYVDHVITPEINAATEALLRQLLEWQERTRRLDPVNARRKRRVVSGMREVEKAVRGRKARALIVAPNIEHMALVGATTSPSPNDPITSTPSEGGEGVSDAGEEEGDKGGVEGEGATELVCPIEPLLTSARANGVPVVFALSRQRLGRIMGQRKRASAFAVLDASGADNQLKALIQLAESSRAENSQ